MTNDRSPPDLLEDFFVQARRCPPEPDAALMAQILRAGLAHQPRPAPVSRRRGTVFAQVLAMLGGWRALGGMATAAAAGVWIGFAGLDRLGDLAGVDLAAPTESMNLLPEGDVVAFLMDQEG